MERPLRVFVEMWPEIEAAAEREEEAWQEFLAAGGGRSRHETTKELDRLLRELVYRAKYRV